MIWLQKIAQPTIWSDYRPIYKNQSRRRTHINIYLNQKTLKNPVVKNVLCFNMVLYCAAFFTVVTEKKYLWQNLRIHTPRTTHIELFCVLILNEKLL